MRVGGRGREWEGFGEYQSPSFTLWKDSAEKRALLVFIRHFSAYNVHIMYNVSTENNKCHEFLVSQ